MQQAYKKGSSVHPLYDQATDLRTDINPGNNHNHNCTMLPVILAFLAALSHHTHATAHRISINSCPIPIHQYYTPFDSSTAVFLTTFRPGTNVTDWFETYLNKHIFATSLAGFNVTNDGMFSREVELVCGRVIRVVSVRNERMGFGLEQDGGI
jgi:hypothetical protein